MYLIRGWYLHVKCCLYAQKQPLMRSGSVDMVSLCMHTSVSTMYDIPSLGTAGHHSPHPPTKEGLETTAHHSSPTYHPLPPPTHTKEGHLTLKTDIGTAIHMQSSQVLLQWAVEHVCLSTYSVLMVCVSMHGI